MGADDELGRDELEGLREELVAEIEDLEETIAWIDAELALLPAAANGRKAWRHAELADVRTFIQREGECTLADVARGLGISVASAGRKCQALELGGTLTSRRMGPGQGGGKLHYQIAPFERSPYRVRRKAERPGRWRTSGAVEGTRRVKIPNKDVAGVVARALQRGWRLEHHGSGGGHQHKLVHANGESWMLPLTPSEYRGIANLEATLRRLEEAS